MFGVGSGGGGNDDGHFSIMSFSDSLDGVFPAEILNGFHQDFNCNIDDFITDCSTINTNSVDCYFPTDNVQTEYLDEENIDFSKVKTERPSPPSSFSSSKTKTKLSKKSSNKVAIIKQPKRVSGDCSNDFPKPTYPYSCLISLALRNSSDGQLSVSDIYSFVCENFPFFEFANPGWKNSIRHNLSLNKNFLKIEQDKTGSRKSCLWQFNPEKLDKVDSELNKYDENEIRRSLRFPEDYDAILTGEKGMPPVSKRAKTPDFNDDENADNTPKIMKQVVEYLSDATPHQKSKQTVRQVAEQALNKLLKVKCDPSHSRVLQPVNTTKASTAASQKQQNCPSTSYESSHSSSSDSNFSQQEYKYFQGDTSDPQELQFCEDDFYQNAENFPEFLEFTSYETLDVQPEDENVFLPPMGLRSFSLNGGQFKPICFDNFQGNLSGRSLKRSSTSHLRPLGTIKDGQFISSTSYEDGSSKLFRTENDYIDYDGSESKENYFMLQ